MKTGLTAERLRQVLHYDPRTGAWIWLVQNSARRPAGSFAGEVKGSGYVIIGIDGLRYRAHRLAWLYMTGEWPKHQIDHKNTDRSDNRWINIRSATNVHNSFNRSANKNNTSGFKGVTWSKQRKKWFAKINVVGQQVHLGFFDDPAVASRAYEEAVQKYAGEFGRTTPVEVTVIKRS
jgi:hypothetical protein